MKWCGRCQTEVDSDNADSDEMYTTNISRKSADLIQIKMPVNTPG